MGEIDKMRIKMKHITVGQPGTNQYSMTVAEVAALLAEIDDIIANSTKVEYAVPAASPILRPITSTVVDGGSFDK